MTTVYVALEESRIGGGGNWKLMTFSTLAEARGYVHSQSNVDQWTIVTSEVIKRHYTPRKPNDTSDQ